MLTWINGSPWADGLIRGNDSHWYTEEITVDYDTHDGYKEEISLHFNDGELKLYSTEFWPTYKVLKIWFIADFDCWRTKQFMMEYAEYVAASYIKNRGFAAIPNIEYLEEHVLDEVDSWFYGGYKNPPFLC